jgi:glycerol uptake facilitator-like aquaporin
MTLARRIVAECLGTAFLLAAVVGSGIMGEKLAGGNIAIALLANTLATGAMLITLIFTFGPISGAHFNPAVTLADASQGGISWSDAPAYIAAQVLGAFIGVAASHLMFGEALLQFSHHVRAGGGQLFSEFIATFGLLCVIWGCARLRSEAVPVAVGLYITGAYWFTASLLCQSSRNACTSIHGHRTDYGAHSCWTSGCQTPRARGRSKTPNERQQDSGCKKAVGKRDTAIRGGAQRVGPHVVSLGASLFADVGFALAVRPRFLVNSLAQRELLRYARNPQLVRARLVR